MYITFNYSLVHYMTNLFNILPIILNLYLLSNGSFAHTEIRLLEL